MPKSAILKRTDETPPVRNGEFVATATVLQISQLAMTSPFVGDFQIIGQGRLIVGEHPDLGERFIVASNGAFAFNPAGTRTFAVWTRSEGTHTGGDVYLGHPDNFLEYDQSEGTLGLYTAAGAGFIADSDGSLFAGDSDGAHMRWNSANRAFEIRNGEDVKSSFDANGDAFHDGTIYANGGRIYGEMQVDSRLRAGDVDGPSVTFGKFERINDAGALIESSEIVATDGNDMPWFRVVAGGSTPYGGWFQVGNPGDYAGKMTYDGNQLQVANWIVDSHALVAPGGYVRMDTDMGIVFVGVNEEPTLPRGEAVTGSNDPLDYMLTFWHGSTADLWPTHRIFAFERAGTPNEQALALQAQPLPGERAYVLVSAFSDMQAQVRIRAVGGYDTAGQQMAYMDLWANRLEGTAPFTHSRMDLSADIIYPMPYTAATIPGGTIQNGAVLNTDGTYDPGGGAGVYIYQGGYFRPVALVADGWQDLTVANDGMTAGNVDYYSCSASGGSFTITIPAATTKPRAWKYTFIKTDAGANTVTLSGTINGAGSYILTTQWQYVTFRRSGGGTWQIIAGN